MPVLTALLACPAVAKLSCSCPVVRSSPAARSAARPDEDSVGTLNDSQSQMMFGSDTGYDPKPVSVNSPDTGYITVGNDGDYFVPKDSDEGKQAFDVWKNAQCG